MAYKYVDFSNILLRPASKIIKEIGEAVAEAQRALDSEALETQKALQERYRELYNIGYQVTWYHIPEVSVDLKVATHYEEKEDKTGLYISPFNAKYQNVFGYSADGTSTIKLRIVPIPHPVISKTS